MWEDRLCNALYRLLDFSVVQLNAKYFTLSKSYVEWKIGTPLFF